MPENIEQVATEAIANVAEAAAEAAEEEQEEWQLALISMAQSQQQMVATIQSQMGLLEGLASRLPSNLTELLTQQQETILRQNREMMETARALLTPIPQPAAEPVPAPAEEPVAVVVAPEEAAPSPAPTSEPPRRKRRRI